MTDYERGRADGVREGIRLAAAELRRQADGWRRPLTPSEHTEATADAYDEAADVVEALAQPPPSEPSARPEVACAGCDEPTCKQCVEEKARAR
jgi:hypothetical protein